MFRTATATGAKVGSALLVICLVCLLVLSVSHRAFAKDSTDNGDYSAITSSWWDEDVRRELLAKAGLSESNFVAVCVGGTKLVCRMPDTSHDEQKDQCRLRHLRQERDMFRGFWERHGVDHVADMRNALKQEALSAFDRSQGVREDFVTAHPSNLKDAARKLNDLRGDEEAERLRQLLEKIDAATVANPDERESTDFEKAWDAACAEMRARGASETVIEILRLEHELHVRRQGSFGSRFVTMNVMRKLQPEVRSFCRWLDDRIASDRREMFGPMIAPPTGSKPMSLPPVTQTRTKPIRAGVNPFPSGRTKRPHPEPVPEPPEKTFWVSRSWALVKECILHQGGAAVLFCALIVLLVTFFSCRSKVIWLVKLLRRQNEFREKYDTGRVSRPLGNGVCWFCGERAKEAFPGASRDETMVICADCAHLVKVLNGWTLAFAFVGGVAVFVVSVSYLYGLGWCGNLLLATVLGAVPGVATHVVLFRLFRISLRHLFLRRLACRDNLEYEMTAQALAAQRREEQTRRAEREVQDGQVSPDASVPPVSSISPDFPVPPDAPVASDGQPRQGESDDPEYLACLAELRRQLAIDPDNDELKEFYDKLVANGKLAVESLDENSTGDDTVIQ